MASTYNFEGEDESVTDETGFVPMQRVYTKQDLAQGNPLTSYELQNSFIRVKYKYVSAYLAFACSLM